MSVEAGPKPDWVELDPAAWPERREKHYALVLKDAQYIQQKLLVGTLARVPLGGGATRPMLERVREAD